ncbi:TIR domain-containing protein [Vibrio atlanticus]|uniref:TIR domain-containing protein n=1 Tax=Vibrio atlanticus TaxID=693153 RepID=UPI003D0C15B8
MYNLLVSGNEDDWDGEPYMLEASRCVREYTDKEITAKFGEFSQEQVDQIRRFPCIFAYEAACEKDPKFGIIKDVNSRKGSVKIEYQLIELDKFISYQDINDMLFELDIGRWEMNRTHWAIKDANLPKELLAKNIKLPSWTRTESKAVDITKHIFDVAFSFPGDVRDYVQELAAEVERELGPHTYFYDNNYKAQLARPSLDLLLQDIYNNRSRLLVVFLCEKYQEKDWCGVEFRAIREILMDRDDQKIMFVRMDDGKVEGVFKTDGYIDGNTHTPRDVASFIRERIELLS